MPAQIHFDLDHPLIQLTDIIEWDELLGLVEQIRQTKNQECCWQAAKSTSSHGRDSHEK